MSGSSKWKCICGTLREKGKGWSNLLSHSHTQHANFVSQNSIEKALHTPKNKFQISTKTLWLNTYLELICIKLQQFLCVEDDFLRSYLNVDVISKNTISKYMYLWTGQGENHISSLLPEHFTIVIDGWKHNETQYVGVFATYPCNKTDLDLENNYSSVLLGYSSLLDETTLSAS